MKILDAINSPDDLRALLTKQLVEVCTDIRTLELDVLGQVGGHVGSNLGDIEATVALHYVFDTPRDKIIWDVSHQAYAHKILTNRREEFRSFRQKLKVDGGISGFTNPDESEYDVFNVGHTSTSIALASGLALHGQLGDVPGRIVAFIGDSAMSGGEAFEGLNFAGTLKRQFLVVLNDNEMSIDHGIGALHNHLEALRKSNGTHGTNMFEAFGFEYRYIPEGNDVLALVEAFRDVRDLDHPVLLHIHTKKGLGYSPAEQEPEKWHWSGAFNKSTQGDVVPSGSSGAALTDEPPRAENVSYRDVLLDFLRERMTSNPEAITIVPGTPLAGGVLRKTHPKQYIDVAIAEEFAASFAGSYAVGGGEPWLVYMCTFLQRAYDQVAQDIAMQGVACGGAAVKIIVMPAGIVTSDYSHVGMFDIPLISNIPNICYIQASNIIEYEKMLEWMTCQNFPVAIRVSNFPFIEDVVDYEVPEIVLGKSEVVRNGAEVAIIGLGNFQYRARQTADLLVKHGISATLINPRFITHLDTELLDDLKREHSLVVTLEDGILDGGFGAKIAQYYSTSDVRVLNYGAIKEFIDYIPYDELMRRYRLEPELIIEDVLELLDGRSFGANTDIIPRGLGGGVHKVILSPPICSEIKEIGRLRCVV
jgi:1-deoxy-D-xylulose-5-phosphate synthase